MTPEPYNPDDLPILAELEHAYHRMVIAELSAPLPATTRSPVAASAPRPAVAAGRAAPRPALAAGRRILGRALAAGALAGAVGATAVATKSVVHPNNASGPRVLEQTAGHELTLRPYQGRSCLDVTYDGGVATRCAQAPAGGAVVPLSAITPGGRVVAGLAGPEVARVVVHSGGRRATAATHPAGDGGLRWFTVVLPTVAREANRAATVAPRRAGGTPAGPVTADCTLGTAASCAAAREHTESPNVNAP